MRGTAGRLGAGLGGLGPSLQRTSDDGNHGASKSVLWARVLLAELGHRQRGPTNIYIDNQSAMHLTRNPMFHERSKHIMNRFHFCREKVHAGLLNFKYISTEANPADICTKAMSTEKKHNRFTEMVLSKRFDLV